MSRQAPVPHLSSKSLLKKGDVVCCRRMFPTIKISITGLDPDEHYRVVMDIVPVDDCRYKYHNSEWVASGKADPHPAGKYFEHQDAPGKGAQFMRQTLSFHKLKLTNNNFDQHGHIILNSMHKYQPRIHIIRDSDMPFLQMGVINTFTFPETCFIAVTAYQNEQITQLKIDNNPFAKGFRDLKTSRRNQELYEFVHPSLFSHQQRAVESSYNSNGQQQSSSSAQQQALAEQQLIGVDNGSDFANAPQSSTNNRKRSIESVAQEPNQTSKQQENGKHHRRSSEMAKPANSVHQTSPKLNAAHEQQLLLAGQSQSSSPASAVLRQQQRIQDEQFAYQQQPNYSDRFSNQTQHDVMVAAQQQQHHNNPYYSYQQQQQRNAMQSFMTSAEQTSNAYGFAAAAAAAAQQPNNGVFSQQSHPFYPTQQHVSSTVHHHHHQNSHQQNWAASSYSNAAAAAAAVAAAAAAYPANAASYNGLQFAYAQQAAAAAVALQSAAGGAAVAQNWSNGSGEATVTTPTSLDSRPNFQSPPRQQPLPNYGAHTGLTTPFGGLGTTSTNTLLDSTGCTNYDPNTGAPSHQAIATTTASLLTAAVAAAAPLQSIMMNQLRPTSNGTSANNSIMPPTSYGLAEMAARAMQSHQFH